MFCVNCGAAVADGVRFCAGCGSAVSAGDGSSPAAVKGGMSVRNVRIMNIVGATGMALLWGLVIVSMLSKMNTLMVVVFAIVACLTVGAPAISALALSRYSGALLRGLAIGLNVVLILMWVLSVVQGFIGLKHSPVSFMSALFSAIFYVLPQVVNIRTLRTFKTEAAMQGAPA